MQVGLIIVDSCIVIDAIDSAAEDHLRAAEFLKSARSHRYLLVMPMHACFEVQCAFRRITQVEGRRISSPFASLESALHIQPQPIDHKFIENYADAEVPYAKAGDTIFLVMAKKLGLPLVTRDEGMRKKALSCGIATLTAEEALAHVAAGRGLGFLIAAARPHGQGDSGAPRELGQRLRRAYGSRISRPTTRCRSPDI